jgi:type VI secretion system protein VasI
MRTSFATFTVIMFGLLAPHPALAEWTVDTSKNEMDDTPIVSAGTRSNDMIEGVLSRPGYAQLHVRCMGGSTDFLLFMAGAYLTDYQDFGNVGLRVDKEKAQIVRSVVSSDNKALGLWNGQGIRLLKSMIGKKQLTVRAAAYGESPQVMVFSLAGFDAALTKVRTACKW